MRWIEVIAVLTSLKVNESVEVEWNDIVGNAQRLIEEVVLVPLSEDIRVLHLEFVESNLGQRGLVRFTYNSCSEICLADIGQIVILPWSFLAGVWNFVDILLTYCCTEYKHRTSNFIFGVE